MSQSQSFTEKLNYLFQHKNKKNSSGKPFSNREVAKEMGLAPTYLWRLRNETAKNPSYEVIEALAKFFDVPPSYFFDEGDLPPYLTNERVKTIALRAAELDEAGQQALLDMANYITKLKRERANDE